MILICQSARSDHPGLRLRAAESIFVIHGGWRQHDGVWHSNTRRLCGGSKRGRKRAFDGEELVLAVELDFSPVQKVLTSGEPVT